MVLDTPEPVEISIQEAKSRGGKIGIYLALTGTAIAYGMVVLLFLFDEEPQEAVFWLVAFDYRVNVLVGVVATLTGSYYLGQRAGVLILIDKQKSALVGIVTAILVLWMGTIIASLVGLAQEGDGGWDSIGDYVVKPLLAVSLVGTIPAVLLGIVFGKWVKVKP